MSYQVILKNRNTLSVEMPTVLSKHKGEIFGKRINVKVNSHWYICQKVQMAHLTGVGVVVANNKLPYNKNVYEMSILASHIISCMKKRTNINWF